MIFPETELMGIYNGVRFAEPYQSATSKFSRSLPSTLVSDIERYKLRNFEFTFTDFQGICLNGVIRIPPKHRIETGRSHDSLDAEYWPTNSAEKLLFNYLRIHPENSTRLSFWIYKHNFSHTFKFAIFWYFSRFYVSILLPHLWKRYTTTIDPPSRFYLIMSVHISRVSARRRNRRNKFTYAYTRIRIGSGKLRRWYSC